MDITTFICTDRIYHVARRKPFITVLKSRLGWWVNKVVQTVVSSSLNV